MADFLAGQNADAAAPHCAIFSLQNIFFGYASPILRNLSLALYPGQSIGITGPNGAGKTSLFRCITGLAKIQAGSINFYGREVRDESGFRQVRRKVGFVLQDAEDQLFFPEVLEDLTFGPLNLGLPQNEAQAAALWALELVGLKGCEHRLSHTLSGGEKKLCAIAAILAMKPAALLLDEPANALDETATAHLAGLVRSLPCSKVIISHEKSFLAKVCDEILALQDGRLARV